MTGFYQLYRNIANAFISDCTFKFVNIPAKKPQNYPLFKGATSKKVYLGELCG